MKKLGLFLATLLVASMVFNSCKTTKDAATIEQETAQYNQAIEQGDFIFSADRVLPRRGSSRSLSTMYTVKISQDTLDVYLPYFGRAYSAPFNPTDGGFKFVSTDFDYQVVAKKKGMYQVTITPKDIKNSDIRGTILRFDMGNNGYASLNVSSDNREPIGFSGTFK